MARRGAPNERSAAPLAAARSGAGGCSLPADHQLPAMRAIMSASHGGELGPLAFDQIDQPGRGVSLAAPHLLDHGDGAYNRNAALPHVAGARITPSRSLPTVE